MDWVLHIGTQKTGSKAIQKFLSNLSSSILEHKICFPISGREGIWHQPIYHELLVGEAKKLKMAVREGTESSAEIGVLSYEGMYLLSPLHIEILFHILGPAKVVLFVRRQDQLVNSMYNQLIKAHRVNFERIKNFESRIESYNLNFDYMSIVERWGEVFGFDHIIPIIYNKNTSSIEKFLFSIGINDIAIDNGQHGENPNPALNFEGLKILKIIKQLNNNDDDLPHLVSVAHRVLQDSFVDTYSEGDQYLLSMSQRRAILGCYHNSNAMLLAKCFPHQDELFPALEADQVYELDQIDPTDSFVDMNIVRMIYHEAKMPIPKSD